MANSWTAGLREMVEMPVEHGLWPVLAWSLTPGEKVKGAIQDAAVYFYERNGLYAQFAFVSALPAGAEEFAEVEVVRDKGPYPNVTLVLADWAPRAFVVLARGGMTRISGEFSSWHKTTGGR